MADEVKKNWKTTVCGICMLVAVVCGAVCVPLLDGNPETVVNWVYVTDNIASGLVLLGVAVPTFLGLLFSKDDDK